MVNGLSTSPPAPALCFRVYPLPQVEFWCRWALLVLVAGLLPLTGRTKYEPDLWHLDGARHNPFKFGRLTWKLRSCSPAWVGAYPPRPACWPNASTFFPNFGTESI